MRLSSQTPSESSELPSIREVWARLGLDVPPPERDRKDSRCPFHDRHKHGDRRPSFAIFDNGAAFKCHGCGAGGGPIIFVAEALNISRKDARRWIGEKFSLSARADNSDVATQPPPRTAPPGTDAAPEPMAPPWKMESGIVVLRREAAASRGLDPGTFLHAEALGFVSYGLVCGFESWILHDREGIVYEGRRTNGLLYPAGANVAERKTHSRCNPGGKKWPVGSDALADYPAAAVLLVEGGPDFIVALGLCIRLNALPVAMLGSHGIHPAALSRFANRKVILSADPGEAGHRSTLERASALRGVGARVAAITHPEHDLNDLYREHGAEELRQTIRTQLSKL